MKKLLFIASLFALLAGSRQEARSQDIHYSHVTFSPLYTNPAFTGYFNGNMRFYANYRNQFYSILGSSAFQTYSGAADFSMPVGIWGKDFVGAGVFAFHDRVGKPEDGGQFLTTSIGLSGSYSKALANDGSHALTIGLMALYMQRRFEGDALFFGSQYDALTGEVIPIPPPSEIGADTRINYNTFDFSVGLLYMGKLSRKVALYTGFSVSHILQPRWSFLDENEAALPIRYAGQLGFNLTLNKRFEMGPFAFFQHQGKVGELVLGNLFDYRIIPDKGIETDLLFGTYFRTLHTPETPFSFESLIILLGIEYTDLRLAFSYDAQFGGLRTVGNTNSAFEVSIQYTMSFLTAKSITRFCPKL